MRCQKNKGGILKMKALKIIILVILSLISFAGFVIYYFFYDMSRLSEGEFLYEVESPDGEYSVKAYLVTSHSTVSNSIRCELVFNKKNSKKKNIYWSYREENVHINWVDENTVNINDHILNVPKDVYDWRRE